MAFDLLTILFIFIICWFFISNSILLWLFRESLIRYWREPVLRFPVVIFESDDWGPGPEEQSAALQKLNEILCRYTDSQGHCPVMTLGLTLAAPNIKEFGGKLIYTRKLLSAPEHSGILEAINRGVEDGVFALQLHGIEHYFPDVIIEAASKDSKVKEWIIKGGQYTELLPDHLQSRWLDTRSLPSSEHAVHVIKSAIEEEITIFETIFGLKPRIAVPNTFAWTEAAEIAWAECGLRFIVTCGKRFTGRDSLGRLSSDRDDIVNGAESNGLTYLVRDAYFEPAQGHRSEQALQTARSYVNCARPILFETHRLNFTSLNPDATDAFDQFDKLIIDIIQQFPQVRFLSTEELGDAITSQSSSLLDYAGGSRLRAWLSRVNIHWPLKKYSRITGAQMLISLLLLLLPSKKPAPR